MCGEQAQIEAEKLDDGGSPPRVRGTVACKALGIGADGITPACAGNR